MIATNLYYRRRYHTDEWKPVSDLATFLEPGGEHTESKVQTLQTAMGKLLAHLVEKNLLDVQMALEIIDEGYLYEIKEGDANGK